MLRWLDKRSKLMTMLLLFWALFWLLNGGDKFFNGQNRPNTEGWSRTAVILDEDGEIIGNVHPVLPEGVYGVNRNNKTANYYERLGLSRGPALATLYTVAAFELIVGAVFLALFAWSLLAHPPRRGLFELFHDRTMHRLAFKGSILIFILFSVADTLFGDRTELWEHGTFLVMAVVTYDSWYRTDRWTQEQEELARAGAI